MAVHLVRSCSPSRSLSSTDSGSRISSSRPFTSVSTGWASSTSASSSVRRSTGSRECTGSLTGQQFHSADVERVYLLFEDFAHAKFHRRSFFDVDEDEEGGAGGFSHVDDRVPQRLVTATGPNPLPR